MYEIVFSVNDMSYKKFQPSSAVISTENQNYEHEHHLVSTNLLESSELR
jgi:hypothetical protein